MTVAAHRFDNAKRRRPDHHERQAMLTPSYVIEPLRELMGGIGLDPCTEPDNPTNAERFYCLPADGCALPWDAPTIFCNPPYGEARNRWVERCIEAGAAGSKVVLLIPAHTETRIFQKALQHSTSVLFIQARLRFGVLRENRRQEAASHGSALIGFNVDLSQIALGVTFRAALNREVEPRTVRMPLKEEAQQIVRCKQCGAITGAGRGCAQSDCPVGQSAHGITKE